MTAAHVCESLAIMVQSKAKESNPRNPGYPYFPEPTELSPAEPSNMERSIGLHKPTSMIGLCQEGKSSPTRYGGARV